MTNQNADIELMQSYIEEYLYVGKYLNEFASGPASDYGISFDQWLIMNEIARSSDLLSVMDLADMHRVTRSAISRQVAGLLKLDYVYEKDDPNDRRHKTLHLTGTGRDVEAKLWDSAKDRFKSWIDLFGREEFQQALAFVRKFDEEVVRRDEWGARIHKAHTVKSATKK
ncbi:MarR family winged helix-turn-helix transcriptional regulator [Furfurilactobacillus siliginis]|uniref:MarR family transcriptional regulator n=1 Tax=Furfurilactobacillus siliginis TaxID=348151 RepID=A0A0R2L4J9_9LACO|nr:MarR family winged helix-turn-helix transcriptional regulator [Furfurilactobacillus siliginis]KRN93671.1 hypothetical protein IV55_GL000978 [Furfurilactobacillus siliginis]GEK28375.1 MarR family transcriptional regulator [Furfurilactobacillus siliginis]